MVLFFDTILSMVFSLFRKPLKDNNSDFIINTYKGLSRHSYCSL